MQDEPPNEPPSDATPNNVTPLRLANGKLVFPGGHVRTEGGTVASNGVAMPTTPDNTPPGELFIRTKRHIADIPDNIRNANACSVIISYTLFGLDDYEIGQALGITDAQLDRVRSSETYQLMFDAVCQSVLDAQSDNVRDIFQQHAKTAANVLVDALHNGSRTEKVGAAKDFLDRAGHRPVDIVEHRHRMEGGLVIEVVRKNKDEVAPVIEMELPDDS